MSSENRKIMQQECIPVGLHIAAVAISRGGGGWGMSPSVCPGGGCLPGWGGSGVICLAGGYTPPLWTDRHLRKHNLSATTVADGNKHIIVLKCKRQWNDGLTDCESCPVQHRHWSRRVKYGCSPFALKKNCSHWQIQGGRHGRAPWGPSVWIFMPFSAKSWKNNPTLGVGAPLRRILDPPLVATSLDVWRENRFLWPN